MSAPTSRRAREEENVEDDNPEECGTASPQGILGDRDALVFSILIPTMTDVNILKNCRLVCKTWNEFACQALRKLAGIFYTVNEPCAQDGPEDKGLKLFENNRNMELSSPFRNFHITAKGFRNPSLLNFLKYLRENPNQNYFIELRIAPSNVDPLELQTALTANPDNFQVTQLRMTGRITFEDEPAAKTFQPEKIRLPSLNELIIGFGGLENDKMLILAENLCHSSTLLKSLDIRNIRCVDKLEKVFSSGGMKSVEKFSFNSSIEPISPENWNRVCRRIMEIPAIKNLNLIFRAAGYNNDWANLGLETLIERYAHSLESLTGDCLPIIKHRRFPHLSEITFKRFTAFEADFAFPVARYPLLKKVAIGIRSVWDPYLLEHPVMEEQSLGVEELTIIVETFQTTQEDLLKFISGAGRVFPNVSTFSFSFTNKGRKLDFTPSLSITIENAFPKMSTLHLDAPMQERRDVAVPFSMRNHYDWEPTHWPFERFPRHPWLGF